MEAPTKGLNPKQLEEFFKNHINKNYGKVAGEKKHICKTCGSTIQQVICYVSVHDARFSGCAGSGEVQQIPLPYCPKCEGEPKNTSTCVHQ